MTTPRPAVPGPGGPTLPAAGGPALRAPVPGPPSPAAHAPPHPGVVAALARLEELDGAPVAEHVEVLDGVHRLLQDALATLDEV